MIKLLMWCIIFYLGYKLVKVRLLARFDARNEPVKGRKKKKSLDLNDLDIEDARYKDLDEK